MSLLEKAFQKEELKWYCFFSIIMYESPEQHLWRDLQKSSHINEVAMLGLWDILKEEKKKKVKK